MTGGLQIGCWLELPSPEVAEIVAGAGFDFALIDLEHGAIGVETAQRMLMALAASATTPVVRVPEAAEAWIKRALDIGAAAVMVPRVDDAATAARARRLGDLRPGGPPRRRPRHRPRRRLGPRRRAYRVALADAGRADPADRSRPHGLAAAPAIAAIPGVTQLFFGPVGLLRQPRHRPRRPARARRRPRGRRRIARAAGREAGSVVFPGAGFAELAAMGFTHAADASDIAAARRRRSTPTSPRRGGRLAVGKGELAADPRGLILEAYRMEIGPAGLPHHLLRLGARPAGGAGTAEIAALLAHYGPRHPDHPMTAVLREGLERAAAPPARRRGRRARRTDP